MRKIFPILVLISAISCSQKEAVAEESHLPAQDEYIPVQETSENTAYPVLQPVKLSESFAAKNNDTLYITNFFATWCGPCMRELPEFAQKMQETKNEKVKFRFVSLDEPDAWKTDVVDTGKKFGIGENIILLDPTLITDDFYTKNFQDWRGESIPFTFIQKNGKKVEINGSINREILDQKIAEVQ